MKTLLPFLMTAIAFAAVAPAGAEAQRTRGKHKVVVRMDDGHDVNRGHKTDDDFRRHDEYRPVADQKYARRHGHIRARLKDDRRDLREIQQITEDWKRASSYGYWRVE